MFKRLFQWISNFIVIQFSLKLPCFCVCLQSLQSLLYFSSSSLTDLFRIDEFKLHVSPSPNDQVPICRVVQKREQELPELQGAAPLVWQTVLLPLTCWHAQHKWAQCAMSLSPILQNKPSTPYPPVFLAQRKRHHTSNKDPCQDESLWRFHWKRLEKSLLASMRLSGQRGLTPAVVLVQHWRLPKWWRLAGVNL